MKKLSYGLLALCLMTSGGLALAPSAAAADTMTKGTMAQDTMTKDTMTKGAMTKDAKMKKDTAGKMAGPNKPDAMQQDKMKSMH